jgi:hypothetical protein
MFLARAHMAMPVWVGRQRTWRSGYRFDLRSVQQPRQGRCTVLGRWHARRALRGCLNRALYGSLTHFEIRARRVYLRLFSKESLR